MVSATAAFLLGASRATTTFEIVIHIQESFYLVIRLLARHSACGPRDSQEGQAVLKHSIYQLISTVISTKKGTISGWGSKTINFVKKISTVLCVHMMGVQNHGWDQYLLGVKSQKCEEV
jgi:hypothetical protein